MVTKTYLSPTIVILLTVVTVVTLVSVMTVLTVVTEVIKNSSFTKKLFFFGGGGVTLLKKCGYTIRINIMINDNNYDHDFN